MSAQESLQQWPHQWFGFWGSQSEAMAFTDQSWQPRDKLQIVQYLKRSPVVVSASAGFAGCLFCDAEFTKGTFQSDGVWLWPDDLAHYVECHSLALPNSLVEHILNAHYVAPQEVTTPLQELPWPA